MVLLLANAAAVLFLTGVIWFVQVVHYPLFAAVGAESWTSYHEQHSRRTTWVVAIPMLVDLVSSLALVAVRPDGVGPVLALAGAALAVTTWAATAGLAVPVHRRLGPGWDGGVGRRLVVVNRVRTAAWTAHAGLVLVALESGLQGVVSHNL